MPPISISRQVPNPNPACDTSSPVTEASTSLARGPHSPIVVQAEVRSARHAPAGRWSAIHLASDIPVAPPVTTRNRSGPSRITVRSARNPPSSSSHEVYTTRPTATFSCATDRFCTASSAAGPHTSSTAKADRSTRPQASRMARCSALMTGDHQRDSHSAGRSISRPAYRSSRPRSRRTRTAAPSRRSRRRTRPSARFAVVDRADPDRAAGFPLLGRVHDAVHLVEALAGPGPDVRDGALVRVEPGGVGLVHVDGGDPAGHELGHRPAAARALLDPAGRGRPQPLGLGHLAQQRVPVRGHRDQPVDRVPDAGPLVAEQFGHQLERLLQLRVEVLLGERHLGGREHRLLDGGDLVRRDDDRAVRVGADLHVAAVLALVHVGVHVADDRVGDLARRVGEQGDRADADHLVHGRGQRQPGPGHPGDPRRPDPAADHHVIRLNLARRRRDAPHPPAGPAGHRRPSQQRRPGQQSHPP